MKAKRTFDIVFSVFIICILGIFSIVLYVVASADTKSNGLFFQQRIGRFGTPFTIFKFKTIHSKTHTISAVGKFFRRSKIDELPQILNIIQGTMSFVGPRPDIAGYYDRLTGEDSKILELKPGLTSEASLKYRNEEALLLTKQNPLDYNDKVIFPDKVRMNLDYYYRQSFMYDIRIILRTIFMR